MSDNSNLTHEALLAAALLVNDLCNLGVHKKLISRSPSTHETLFLLTTRLDALGYMEQYRHGYAAIEH